MKKYIIFFSLVISSLLLTSCSSGGSGTKAENITIGIMSPTQSSDAEIRSYAKNLEDATKLAATKINAAGGVNGKQIRLCIAKEDTSAPSIKLALRDLVKRCNAVAIIGGVISDEILNAKDEINNLQIPIISPSATTDQIFGLSPYIFTISDLNDSQAVKIGGYISEQKINSNIGVIVNPSSAYSINLTKDISEVLKTINIGFESFPFNGNVNQLIESINNSGKAFSGFYIAAPQTSELNDIFEGLITKFPNVKYYGGDTWYDKTILSFSGLTTDNNVFTSAAFADPANPQVIEFYKSFVSQFSYQPNISIAPVAYDALTLLTSIINKTSTTSSAEIVDALNKDLNFSGLAGNIDSFYQGAPTRESILLNATTGNTEFNIVKIPTHK